MQEVIQIQIQAKADFLKEVKLHSALSVGVSLTVAGRLMLVIVRVKLVVRVDMLFLQWRRRCPRCLHPRRQEGTRHPEADTEKLGIKSSQFKVIPFLTASVVSQ